MRTAAVCVWVSIATIVGGCASPQRQTAPATSPVTVDFSSMALGRPPAGFTTGLTGGGGPSVWTIRSSPPSPAGGNVLVQETADDTSYRFPLCIYNDFSARDVAAEVKFKSISGAVDQASGIVLRYSLENYYIARANTLEDNVNVFKTVNGKRLKIAEVEVKMLHDQWQTLGFSAQGAKLTVTLDGKVIIEAMDSTITSAGQVGLWTKADSVSAFSDFKFNTLP